MLPSCDLRDVLERGERGFSGKLEKGLDVGEVASVLRGGHVEIGEEAIAADRTMLDVVGFKVRLHCPSGHGSDASAAGDQLEYGDRQLGAAALGRDAGWAEYLPQDIDAFAVDRIGDERLLAKVLGGEVRLSQKAVLVAQDAAFTDLRQLVDDPQRRIKAGAVIEAGAAAAQRCST